MEILLNKMYTGSFTTTAIDIGHEIINFFKTDDGENYVYVVPYGGMAKEHNDQISHILFTGAQKDDKFEILAKVVGHEQIFRHGNRGNKTTNAEQVQYIIENNIKYGGKYLHKIMQHNTGNSEATYVSFKAQKIIRAKKPIIVDQSSAEFSEINLKRSKGFVHEGGLAYDTLVKMINDDSLWEDDDTTKTVDVSKYTKIDDTNFLQLIRKEHDETIFTNLFHYYLSQNSTLRDQFVKFLLGVESDDYSVEREKVASDKENKSDDDDKKRTMDRMDLWLEGKENITIIENKIKSGINGSRHDVNGELVQSQLSAYYNYAAKKGKKVHCYIFAPNYNEVDTEKGLYMHNDKYKIIRYRDIYNFFNDPIFVDLFKDDPFGAYTQFVSALSMHIYKPDEEMEKRFVNMINS